MGLRDRKNHLILVLKAKALANKLSPEKTAEFEMRYRRAGSQEEQDQVTRDLDAATTGWKTGTSVYDRLMRTKHGLDTYEDEDLPPSLERTRMTFIRKK